MNESGPAFRSEKLRRLFEHWKGMRGARRFPSRRDFDPLDLGYALGDIVLVDVLREPLRFRFRLDGTHAVERFGVDMTGKTLDSYPDPEMRAVIDRSFRDVVGSGEAAVRRRDMIADDRLFTYEAAILPLAADGETIDMLLVAMDFDLPRSDAAPGA